MDDFIRPEKPVQIQPKKKKPFIKEFLIIILIICCIGIGFVMGYLSHSSPVINLNSNDKDILNEVYNILDENWVNTTGEDIDINSNTIQAMVDGLGDIHTAYWSSDEKQQFNDAVNGNYEGIGVGFSVVSQGALVVRVYDDSPASAAKLQVGDILAKADGVSLAGLSSDEVREVVRGDNGSVVKIEIIRGNETLEVELTRASLSTAVEYEVRETNGKKFGYVQITTFGTSTASEVEEALQAFKKADIDTLVFDLRDNGGGYLTAAVGILDLFFDEGEVIYQMQQKNGPAEKTRAGGGNKYKFDTNYILVNGNSASASEMVAGALQEECDFQLVGNQTYGKGTAQTQVDLSDGSTLKYTYAKWMTPSGICVNGEGLTPDIKVENFDISNISTEPLEETLKYDQVHGQVVSMQKMLQLLGYDCGRIDGYFSQQSKDALEAFEKDKGLNIDGEYSNDDHLMLIAQTMIYINNKDNDLQYKKILEIIQ